ncbi:MAG: 3-phosphoshikimate 1-carboxyvinyltransferase [Deltaproteobacteria bacterium]|jgi:3-phosphoshikimate 1-carboxyvinyltransferase|nr:3-phosphoshikimate 1-carboxyvinyltransferase [Deltaproteobacteria bacterium]
MRYQVEKSSLSGSLTVTASKSHTMRAVLLASMAKGRSLVRHPLASPDTVAMITACSALGAKIEEKEDALIIEGVAGRPAVPSQVIDVGNSGQVLRFGAAMAALLPLYSIFTGDASVRAIRPMNPLLEALTQLGAFAVSSKNDGHAPVIIRGPVRAGTVVMEGMDSQPVSAVLMLAGFLPGVTAIQVKNPGEQPWIDLTLYWLDKMGIGHTNDNYLRYTVQGRDNPEFAPFDYTVPGDWSSAAFPVAAALVTNSSLQLNNMDIHDPQGDKAVLEMFRAMGARIVVDDQAKTVLVQRHGGLHGTNINVNAAIDAVPVLAAVACFAGGSTVITGASIARHKESDRLAAISAELGKMGAKIEEFEDGLTIHPSVLHGAQVDSRHDHRIAMSLAVAALAAGGASISDTDCVAKSFPGFAAAMRGVGAAITEQPE